MHYRCTIRGVMGSRQKSGIIRFFEVYGGDRSHQVLHSRETGPVVVHALGLLTTHVATQIAANRSFPDVKGVFITAYHWGEPDGDERALTAVNSWRTSGDHPVAGLAAAYYVDGGHLEACSANDIPAPALEAPLVAGLSELTAAARYDRQQRTQPRGERIGRFAIGPSEQVLTLSPYVPGAVFTSLA